MFSFFINKLTVDIQNSGAQGLQLTPSLIQVLLLLSADDVALFADTIASLQILKIHYKYFFAKIYGVCKYKKPQRNLYLREGIACQDEKTGITIILG